AAGSVERARDARVVAARTRGEARAAAQVHRVAETRAELGEVPRAPVLAAEVGVAREAGQRGAVAADARHLALLLRSVVLEQVEGWNRRRGAGGLTGGGGEEDLAVEHLGREGVVFRGNGERMMRRARDHRFHERHALALPGTVGTRGARGRRRALTAEP